MTRQNDLQRFLDSQESDYAIALNEIRSGRKRSHWMWYIFPQIKGLGFSSTSQYFAIKDIEEASAYLANPVLGKRLIEITNALLTLQTDNANEVFSSPDDMKLRSSMTLFAEVPGADGVFQKVLDKFFDGKKDEMTLLQL
jgi:uncharacterized protein (DUF1810 family)